jgi:hypothetical protein
MSKKKKKRGSKAKKKAPGRAAARERLATLIREKETAVGDGSVQVLLAIAAVSTLVTVDTSTNPPTVTPENIGSLTFGDPLVGLADKDMPTFKSNLKCMLRKIAREIDKIPDSASLNIGEVAKFVRLALLDA